MVNTRNFYSALTAVLIALALAACGRSDPASLVESAKSYLAKGNAKAAIIQLKNALQEAPNNADARFLLAKSLLETGDAVAAETEARKALDLKYSADEAYPLLARALLQQGEFRKVVTDLADRKLASPQAQAEVLTAIGQARLGLGEKKEAREAIAAALALRPGEPRAILAQAQLAAADNDLPAAMMLVDTALAARRRCCRVAPQGRIGGIAQNRRDDGIKTLERALQIRPDLLAARFALVSVLAQSGQAERAAAQLEPVKKSLAQDPRTISPRP
jgi:tetratricopeptide (TPR) repeat protein